MLNCTASKEKMNKWMSKTCLNVNHWCFVFPLFNVSSKFTFMSYLHSSVRSSQKNDSCNHCSSHLNRVARSFLIDNTFLTMSKHHTTNTYWWSHKTLVTMYRRHLWVNGICAKSLFSQKTNNEMLFFTGSFQQQCCCIKMSINDIVVTSLQ